MNFESIIVAVATFFIIGVFHPIVIKCEYYFSKKIWPLFLVVGIGFLIVAVFIHGIVSVLLAITGTSCLWSIKELFEQEKSFQKSGFQKI